MIMEKAKMVKYMVCPFCGSTHIVTTITKWYCEDCDAHGSL